MPLAGHFPMVYDHPTPLTGLDIFVQLYVHFVNRRFSIPANTAWHDKMVALVERMLELHKQKQSANSEAARQRLEREINVTDKQIDALVYELYGLTEEEIKIVEGSA